MATAAEPSNKVVAERREYDYGGNPLVHYLSHDSAYLPAFGGSFQPGLYRPSKFNFGNPVPLGLSGFALTTFLLSCINLGVRGLASPSIVIGPAMVYGGFIQLLAGMWEVALGNVFGATALSSYGGFWISVGVILTPGGFQIQESYANTGDFYAAFGLYLYGWFIFTFLLWLLTLRSTLAFTSLFFCVWVTFVCLATSYLDAQNNPEFLPNQTLLKTGGGFGIVAGFIAWYNMLAGIAEPSNSFIALPVVHFPWSEKGREARRREKEENGDHLA